MNTPVRLDAWLASKYPDTSRSVWQKYIKVGYIKLNGQLAVSAKTLVGATDVVEIDLPTAPSFDDHDLPIIYLDQNVIVVNKPAGVLTHAKGGIVDEFTVADMFSRYAEPDLASNRTGVVHRLDRATSGVIIGARNQPTAAYLARQFANRRVVKTYQAIVHGVIDQPELRIDIPIGRNSKKPSTFRADPSGKPAITDIKALESGQHYTRVELRPETGRTHQLRVHLAHIGHPIVGDPLYSSDAHKHSRLYLHAASLKISIAHDQEQLFSAPVPAEFGSFGL